jgi:sulfite reductase (ferredoxin)
MDAYVIPQNYLDDIESFSNQVKDFRKGDINPVAFKGIRVAQGIYEQRIFDTYMVRMRNTGGIVTPRQFKRVAELSAQYGKEHFHVTTRQDLQLHYVDLENIKIVQEELRKVGISTRGGGGNTVRNIMVAHDSGIAKDEVFDVTPHAVALTTRMIHESDSWDLPRKFKMAFSSNSEDRAQATITCLGFIARIVNGKRGFRVYGGGGMGSQPMPGQLLLDFLDEAELYNFVKAVKIFFDRHGNRRNRLKAKIKFLIEKLGVPEFMKGLQEVWDQVKSENHAPLDLNLPDLENINRTAPGLPVIQASGEKYEIWKNRYVREQKQPGLYTIKVPLYLGDIDNPDGILLADLLESFGENTCRLGMNQNLHLRNIPEAYIGNIWEGLTKIKTLSTDPVIISNLIACTGADTCKLGLCLPRGVLPEITDRLLKSDLDLDRLASVRIHVSGCPNSCGRHHAADLGFFGRAGRNEAHMYPAYNILAGARIKDESTRFGERIDMICSRHVPQFVVDLLKVYQSKQDQYASFTHYIDADGKEDIKKIADTHRTVPTYEQDLNYYFDWGAKEEFSILKGQKAECAASVFDMISIDAAAIREGLSRIDDAGPKELHELVLLSSRILLITRGIEPGNPETCFNGFLQHFIRAGLVSPDFEPLVLAALNEQDLTGLRLQIGTLATLMLKLQDSLDDSLRFHNEEATPVKPVATATTAREFRDFKGVACPMNYVKTKIVLEPMARGSVLEILLDDGEPIANVPNSLKLDGHLILEQKQMPEGHWQVVIQKG